MEVEVKFTIITVSFNSKKTIEKTIRSVLNQTYQNYEYLIIDGKSDDGTVEIIREFEQKFDGKLNWISEEDDGLYYAMNKGIEKSSGDIIGIIHSDDWFEKNTLEIISNEYKKNSNCVFYGLLKVWNNNRETHIYSNNHYFLPNVMIQHPTVFIPKKIYEKNGLFNTDYKIAADYDLMLRLYYSKVDFIQIERVLANFSTGGLSGNNRELEKEIVKIKREHKIYSNKKAILVNLKDEINNSIKTIKSKLKKVLGY